MFVVSSTIITIIIFKKIKALLTIFYNKLNNNMWSTTFHTNLTGKILKVLNITIFQISNTAIYSIFTNYETDNIKERKLWLNV